MAGLISGLTTTFFGHSTDITWLGCFIIFTGHSIGYLMKKCYVSVLISVVKLSFNKMNTG